MKKPFDTLYANLEKSLNDLERQAAGVDRYGKGILLIIDKIRDMRGMAVKHMGTRALEVEYFRHVWPAFYGMLLLYIRQYQFEVARLSMPARALPRMIRREERKAAEFLGVNRDFWMYCKAESPTLDEQFTRAYSHARIYDPLALVIDQEGATLSSYRAAWCLAMEGYAAWLGEERERGLDLSGRGEGKDYTWGPADTDFVEWLYLLQGVGAVKYKGEVADMSRLQKWAKWALGKEVVNIYDRFKVLRNRKKERMAFTKRAVSALERTMDAKEGKY
jgi:hypothetical protein